MLLYGLKEALLLPEAIWQPSLEMPAGFLGGQIDTQ